MPANDKSQLPDPTDEKALAKWLEDKPRPLVVAFACRMALLALPGLGSLKDRDFRLGWGQKLVLSTLRAAMASWVAANYPTVKNYDSANAAAVATGIPKGKVVAIPSAAYRSARTAGHAAYTPTDTTMASAVLAVHLAVSTANSSGKWTTPGYDNEMPTNYTAYNSEFVERDQFWLVIEAEMVALSNVHESPAAIARYLASPLRLYGDIQEKLARLWTQLTSNLQALNADWDVWLDWADARIQGQADWPKSFYDELTKWREEWDRDPREVNADIKRLLEEARESTSADDEEIEAALKQQPGSYEFWEEDDHVYARSVPSPPFNPLLAQSLLDELREKCREAAEALTGNNADEQIHGALTRLAALLDKSADALEIARVLSRNISIEAHRNALFDAKSESDRTIRAHLDDVANSARALLGCYPDIERISATLLALNLQGTKAKDVEKNLRAIEAKAADYPNIDVSALEALREGRIDFDELGQKAMTASLERAAQYIEAQALVVRTRLINAVNFMSALVSPALNSSARTVAGLAKTVGSEAGEYGKEINKEVKAGVAKAFGQVGHFGILTITLYLANQIIPMWLLISASAIGLAPYVKIAKKLTEDALEAPKPPT